MVAKMSRILFAFMLVAAVSLLSCTKEEAEEETTEMAMRTALAKMNATEGNEAHGTVTFTEVEGGIKVVAHFEGVPESEHGFHIHEKGDCSSDDGKSAGGHWNPAGMPHAGRDAEQRHVGDLGNLTANAEGSADAEFVDSMLTFDGDHSIIGKGVILHAGQDDLTSQPTGAAGARIACGVIELVEKDADGMSSKTY